MALSAFHRIACNKVLQFRVCIVVLWYQVWHSCCHFKFVLAAAYLCCCSGVLCITFTVFIGEYLCFDYIVTFIVIYVFHMH